MLLKSVQQINKWGVDRIQEYTKSIGEESIQKLKEKGFIIEDEAWRGSHLFGIRLPQGLELSKVKAALLKHKVYVSYRGTALRVAPNVYNTEKDFQKLVRVLSKL